jgi:hypothetical protein
VKDAPRFVIFGGGCYGSFYARQLVRAAAAGAEVGEILVVDHNEKPAASELTSPLLHFITEDWDDFCDAYFSALAADSKDQIVPPPFTPHLALRWLLRQLPVDRRDLEWSLEPIRRLPGTPYQSQSLGGPLTLSHADWTCPVHCIEPDLCPATRSHRYWDLADTVRLWTGALEADSQPVAQTHLFQCLHFTHGVGTYPAAQVVAARRDMAASNIAAGESLRFLVGTVSRCHGAIHMLRAVAGTDTV